MHKEQNQGLTDAEQSFVQRTQERMHKAVEPVMLEMLAEMVAQEIPAYDINYIEKRVKQILEQKFKDVSFKSEVIRKARRGAFVYAVQEAQKAPAKLEKDKDPLTEARNKRCEKVALAIAEKMLDVNMLEADEDFLNEAIEQDEELLAQNRIRTMLDALMERLTFSINESIARAQKKIWGKEKEDVTLMEIDKILKQK